MLSLTGCAPGEVVGHGTRDMIQPRIVLSGLSPRVQGLEWTSDRLLRIGRQGNADVPLDDPSVGRTHAEVYTTGQRWLLRDLANQEKHPTFVNGVRVGRSDCR